MFLSASSLEQNRILGDTELGEVAEAAPPTSERHPPREGPTYQPITQQDQRPGPLPAGRELHSHHEPHHAQPRRAIRVIQGEDRRGGPA